MFDKSMPSQRTLLLILLPPLVIGLLLGIHFLWSQSTQRQSSLIEHGRLLGEQLAILSAPALRGQDQPYLQRLLAESLEHQHLRSVVLMDASGNPVASAGPRPKAPPPELDAQRSTFSGTSEQSRLRFPVYSTHLLDQPVPIDTGRQLLGWVDLELSHQSNLIGLYRDLMILTVLCVFGLSLLLPLVYRLYDALRSPMNALAGGLARLRDGQMQTRLPCETGNTELDVISRDFNHLAEQLEYTLKELESGTDQTTADLRQSMETLERQNIEMSMELAELRKKMRDSSRTQSSFLANMGHEIRTPLNAVLGFIRLLHKTSLDAHQRECVHHIDEAAHNLLTLVTNILDLSKLRAGKLKLLPGPLDLRDLIDDALAMYAPQAHEKQLELISLYYHDTPRCLIGDASRLRQILGNLLSNAIKFTNQGEIIIRTQLEDEFDEHVFLRISVQDTGTGISEENQQQLFRAFTQLDNSSTRHTSGSGLGLAICRNLVEQMDGEIGVHSELGKGAEFWLTLKLQLSGEQEASPPPQLQDHPVALLAPREPLRFQLRALLEDCRMPCTLSLGLPELVKQVTEAREQGKPFSIAVIDTGFTPASPLLREALEQLQRLECRVLLLSPASQVRQMEGLLNGGGQVLNRPAGNQRLIGTLAELLAEEQTTPVTSGPLAAHRPKILCVDDHAPNLLLLRTLLEDLGCQVTAVDSGQAAVDACLQQCFDLVFMDVQMPGMDGRQATERIRHNELGRTSCPPVPIVALTAHALEAERRALLQGGMDDYLNKPATPPQLLQTIRKWTSLAREDGEASAGCALPGPPGNAALFNPQESLQLAAGNAGLAADLLRMLLDSLPSERESVQAAREVADNDMLIERVHRIHGATRYCGVPELRQACQQAETLLKQHQPADAALDALDTAIQRLLELAPQMPGNGEQP